MSDVKWIKVSTEIFDDEKIKIIDALPDRDAILVIWMKLIVLAGRLNEGGSLIMNGVPLNAEMISAVTLRALPTVRLALEMFERFGMIEIDGNGVVTLQNWGKHQSVEKLDKVKEQTRLRVQRLRDRQKKDLEKGDKSNAPDAVTSNADKTVTCNASNAPKNKNKNIKKESIKRKSDTGVFRKPSLKQLETYIKEENLAVDAQEFFDSNEAKGWVVGKYQTPMKNWKSAVQTWHHRAIKDKEDEKKKPPAVKHDPNHGKVYDSLDDYKYDNE